MTETDAAGSRPPVSLRIEELALEGFSPHDRHRIRDSVEQELARLLAREDSLERLGRLDVERVQPPGFTISAGLSPREIGRQIARSLAEGLLK